MGGPCVLSFSSLRRAHARQNQRRHRERKAEQGPPPAGGDRRGERAARGRGSGGPRRDRHRRSSWRLTRRKGRDRVLHPVGHLLGLLREEPGHRRRRFEAHRDQLRVLQRLPGRPVHVRRQLGRLPAALRRHRGGQRRRRRPGSGAERQLQPAQGTQGRQPQPQDRDVDRRLELVEPLLGPFRHRGGPAGIRRSPASTSTSTATSRACPRARPRASSTASTSTGSTRTSRATTTRSARRTLPTSPRWFRTSAAR